jgi:uncharacterized protein (DUF433 family)
VCYDERSIVFQEAVMSHPHITVNMEVMMGKPVIAGTRITVEHILREMAAGTTTDQLLEMHPHITREDIQIALDYVDHKQISFVEASQC